MKGASRKQLSRCLDRNQNQIMRTPTKSSKNGQVGNKVQLKQIGRGFQSIAQIFENRLFIYWNQIRDQQQSNEIDEDMQQYQLEVCYNFNQSLKEKIKFYYIIKNKYQIFDQWRQQVRKNKYSSDYLNFKYNPGIIKNPQIKLNYLHFINSINTPSILQMIKQKILMPSLKNIKFRTQSSSTSTPTIERISGEKDELPNGLKKPRTKAFQLLNYNSKKLNGLTKCLNKVFNKKIKEGFKQIKRRVKQVREEEEYEQHKIQCILDLERRKEQFILERFSIKLYPILYYSNID